MTLFRNEIFKILKRAEAKGILIITLIIPLIIGVLVKSGSKVIDFSGMSNAAMFVIGLWALFRLLMLIYLIPIFMISSNLGYEIDSGIINLFVTRYSRIKYFFVKQCANLIYITIFYIVYIISSFVSYFIFLKNSNTLSLAISVNCYVLYYGIFLGYLELIILAFLVHSLSAKLGSIGSGIAGMLIIIFCKILVKVDFLRKFLPTEITDISRIIKLEVYQVKNDAVTSIILMMAYSLTIFTFGLLYFKNRNL
jgi:hypothetical protein